MSFADDYKKTSLEKDGAHLLRILQEQKLKYSQAYANFHIIFAES